MLGMLAVLAFTKMLSTSSEDTINRGSHHVSDSEEIASTPWQMVSPFSRTGALNDALTVAKLDLGDFLLVSLS
jgi:hypothetical protein